MTRAVSVGRSFNGLVAAGALGLTLLTTFWAGCAGSLDPGFTGAAGTSGGAGMGAAGMSGTSGTAGMAGTGGGVMGCDIAPLVTKYTCAMAACHDATGTSAKFSMVGNWESMLVGVKPVGGGTLPSMCMASTVPYIISKSATGDGLFLQKLKAAPSCGGQMPFGLSPSAVSDADFMCFQKWATALANK